MKGTGLRPNKTVHFYLMTPVGGDVSLHDHEFDIVIAIGVVYTMTLRDCISCLKEIQRVGNGKSFITMGSYYDEESKRLFKDYWSLLGSTVLHVDEWIYVLKEAGYTGDYTFVTSDTLNLVENK